MKYFWIFFIMINSALGQNWSLYKVLDDEIKLIETNKVQGVSIKEISSEFKLIKILIKSQKNISNCLYYEYENDDGTTYHSSLMVKEGFAILNKKKITLSELMRKIDRIGVKKLFSRENQIEFGEKQIGSVNRELW